jgi:RNA polymerase sigma factor (sigma-70 family)
MPAPAEENTIPESVGESIDHLFRHQAGQMVSVLSRIFGIGNLDLIEDAVQDALVAALKTWPYNGYPDNQKAWLIEAAKNRVLDRLRYGRRFTGEDIADAEYDLSALKMGEKQTDTYFAAYFTNEISEDQLRMIFACCHPLIAPDSQVALTLKIVGGFSVSEIARAFLAKDDAIAKMLTRAKQKLRENTVQLEMPSPGEIPARLEAVTKVLYLMFNEGYSASEGEELVRQDLCFEAIRLCLLLASHPLTDTPKINALAALFLFQGARLSSRSDTQGELLLLSEHDRSLWNQVMIATAMKFMQLSARGDELTGYHLEAEIASAYTLAETFADTDWRRILDCYELLQKRTFSPIVELNRIIVLSKIHGAKKALMELENLDKSGKLKDHNLFHITYAHFLSELGENNRAIAFYQKAAALTQNEPIRRFLEKKIAALLGARTHSSQ